MLNKDEFVLRSEDLLRQFGNLCQQLFPLSDSFSDLNVSDEITKFLQDRTNVAIQTRVIDATENFNKLTNKNLQDLSPDKLQLELQKSEVGISILDLAITLFFTNNQILKYLIPGYVTPLSIGRKMSEINFELLEPVVSRGFKTRKEL